jgi:hypothetical protein
MAFAGSRAAVDVRPHRAGNLVLRAAPAARYGEFCGALRALACRQSTGWWACISWCQ